MDRSQQETPLLAATAYFYQGREMTRFGRVRSGVVALSVASSVGVFGTACGSEEGPDRKSITAQDAADRVEQRGVHVPDGFEFAQGFVWPIDSVGTSAFAVRFDGPGDQFRTLRADDISGVLSEFEDLPCAGIPSPHRYDLVELGLACPAGGGARISRDQSGRDPDQSLSQGERAVILNSTPTHTQVFVVYGGT